MIIAFIVVFGLFLIFFSLNRSKGKEIESLNQSLSNLKDMNSALGSELNSNKRAMTITNRELEKLKALNLKRHRLLEELFSLKMKSMPYLAGMIADYITLDIEGLANSLDWGKNKERAKKVASIREIRKAASEKIAEAKVAVYQLEYLKQLYPSLEDILETDYEDLTFDSKLPDYEDFDPIRNYLSREEWTSLSETEKNQRALDNYIASHRKTNWQIGRDYELYIGYLCEKQGYKVDYYGSINKLDDLGRDLIAIKGDTILIIQCKYWSGEKSIHEKHINQLFGTTISYSIENK